MRVTRTIPWLGSESRTSTYSDRQEVVAPSGAGKSSLCRAVADCFGGTLRGGVACRVQVDGEDLDGRASKVIRSGWPTWARQPAIGRLVGGVDLGALAASGGRELAGLLASTAAEPVDVRQLRLAWEAAVKEAARIGDPGEPPDAVPDADLAAARATLALESAWVAHGQAAGQRVEGRAEPLTCQVVEGGRVRFVEASGRTHQERADWLRARVEELRAAFASASAAAEAAAEESATAAQILRQAALDEEAAVKAAADSNRVCPTCRRPWSEPGESDCADDLREAADRAREVTAAARARAQAAEEALTIARAAAATVRGAGESTRKHLDRAAQAAAQAGALGALAQPDRARPTEGDVLTARDTLERSESATAWRRAHPEGRGRYEEAARRRDAAADQLAAGRRAALAEVDRFQALLDDLAAACPLRVVVAGAEVDGEVRLTVGVDVAPDGGEPVDLGSASSGERVVAGALLRWALLRRAGWERPWLLVDDAQDWSEGFRWAPPWARFTLFATSVAEESA